MLTQKFSSYDPEHDELRASVWEATPNPIFVGN